MTTISLKMVEVVILSENLDVTLAGAEQQRTLNFELLVSHQLFSVILVGYN